ncbi:hypothetical protein LIPSTDRAFT_174639 [Lipomyces starkeyi NRRL Y-11557]|uniref:Uncharacterized protein n=1 Tax=Lipomyces starkeyi NRRL Y-11557 TaxID=675824 RepID=A0A1E3PZ64_LIPST|nr:hypothetical protein LIPSTDRAFT_174639 [Lipomyces starkeyi NRRL Y-11557]
MGRQTRLQRVSRKSSLPFYLGIIAATIADEQQAVIAGNKHSHSYSVLNCSNLTVEHSLGAELRPRTRTARALAVGMDLLCHTCSPSGFVKSLSSERHVPCIYVYVLPETYSNYCCGIKCVRAIRQLERAELFSTQQ